MSMVQSIRAVLIGILLALFIGALVVFGIAAPILTRFYGLEIASTAFFPAVFVVFAAAFAFYWGAMYASYYAPGRRRLHGMLVGVLSFASSPVANLVAYITSGGSSDPFTSLRSPGALVLTGVLLVVVLATSYVGARRGETLHAHNQAYLLEQERRRKSRKDGSSRTKS